MDQTTPRKWDLSCKMARVHARAVPTRGLNRIHTLKATLSKSGLDVKLVSSDSNKTLFAPSLRNVAVVDKNPNVAQFTLGLEYVCNS